jgi:hypothetical protein
MKCYANINSYTWTYDIWEGDGIVHANCYRHSGPVSKYTSISFPLPDLASATIRDKVETHLTQWAETNGA